MDFGLTDEQEAFRDAVRRFARSQLAPTYLQRAKTAAFPWDEHRRVAELGVLALLAGPEWGGPDPADFVALGLAVEELACADFNVANCAIPVAITTSILAQHAARAIQEEWLPALVAGERFVALGLTEPDSGSDAAAMRTTATRKGDGWSLDGEKTSVTAIPYAQAAVVFAKTDRAAAARGVSAFLVPLDAPGVRLAPIPDSGWLPVGRGSIALDGVEVPGEALLGGEGNGFRAVMSGFDFTRPLLALTGIGCAQAVVDETAAYVADRRAFGSPLAAFEGISFPLAEHATHLHAARLVCYETLWARGAGRRHTAGAAMAKWLGPFVASRAIHDCLLLHGHYGYTTDNAFEQRLRDVLAVEIADGTAQIQKIIIARELFGRAFVPYGKGER